MAPESLESQSDAELLNRSLAGDEAAFLVLYEKLKGGIFRYAFYMTSSITAAEEVTQEVFISLLREGEKGSYRQERGDVGAFAFGIARNFVRRIKRREGAYQPLPNNDALERLTAGFVAEPEALSQKIIRNEVMEQVQAAIASLPDHYAQVVVLCDLCEFSYADAAFRLRCAVGTVRSRLNRAHTLLARKLKRSKSFELKVRTAGAEGCII
jgi:RNA polymerase sigma-70 factor (ECF subfamily)